ncbi:hypothetical protein [Candidatus Phytoplasma fraxini]|uniref:hypothetical protein n=1 Tax=Ash yellows phytoplasma TaxID=35780 RepID=UPI0030FE45E0
MKVKLKILLNISLVSIIFCSAYSLNANSNLNNQNNEELNNYPIITKLKTTFPKLNKPALLKKVLNKILEEFDKNYYNQEKKDNIKDKIQLLEKYGRQRGLINSRLTNYNV